MLPQECLIATDHLATAKETLDFFGVNSIGVCFPLTLTIAEAQAQAHELSKTLGIGVKAFLKPASMDEAKKRRADHTHFVIDLLEFPNVREVIEQLKPAIVYNFEYDQKSDSLRQPRSNMDHVIAKLMHTHGTAYGISLSQLQKAPPEAFARLAQNLKLCRKHNVKVMIANFSADPQYCANKLEKQAFLRLMGYPA